MEAAFPGFQEESVPEDGSQASEESIAEDPQSIEAVDEISEAKQPLEMPVAETVPLASEEISEQASKMSFDEIARIAAAPDDKRASLKLE